jgi:hypothetical protein
MQTCKDCPTPGKCREAGKCLNKKKTTKKMATPKRKPRHANPNHPMNTERTTSNPSGKYST